MCLFCSSIIMKRTCCTRVTYANLDLAWASTSLVSSSTIPDPMHVYGDRVSSDVSVLLVPLLLFTTARIIMLPMHKSNDARNAERYISVWLTLYNREWPVLMRHVFLSPSLGLSRIGGTNVSCTFPLHHIRRIFLTLFLGPRLPSPLSPIVFNSSPGSSTLPS